MDILPNEISDNINNRNEIRENEIIKRRESNKNQISDKQPLIKKFQSNFKVMKSEYINNIEKCKDRSDFDKCSDELMLIQNLISEAVNYLPNYDIYQAQKIIDQYKKELVDKRDSMVPRKVFSFSKKRKNITKEKIDIIKPIQKKNYNKFLDNEIGIKDINDDPNLELTVKSNDVSLVNLTNCTVKIFGTPASIHMINISNCSVISSPVNTSIMIENCKQSTIVIACQQLRLHSASDTDIYLHVITKAIIEDCKTIRFAQFNDYSFNGEKNKAIGNSYTNSELFKEAVNTWNSIDDFNWLSTDIQSPNWSIIPKSELSINL